MRFQSAFVATACALLPTVFSAPQRSSGATQMSSGTTNSGTTQMSSGTTNSGTTQMSSGTTNSGTTTSSTTIAYSNTSTTDSTATCENSAANRTCWGDYDISTNYYEDVPDTGVTREYWFSVENSTVAPDGFERIGLTINGSVPGPTIIADWGDNVIVHVTNNMQTNGTGIHWHGIRQNYTNEMDGVPSITQCPIPPGSSYTYKWRATQYGSSWYHSHFSLQAWDGVFGGILINGPATSNYDVDLGHVFLNDWTHVSVNEMYLAEQISGPQELDNGLINGTNTFNGSGSRFEQSVTSGNKYLFRLVNGAIDTHWKFMIDNHTLTVVAADFVPIVPYTAEYVSIGMGQRYDVIVEMDQAEADYWIRAIPQETCSDNANADDIKGILRYDSSSTSDPTSTGYSYDDSCDDEDMANLVPYLALDASADDVEDDFAVTVAKPNSVLFKWFMAGTTFVSQWDDPTILQAYDGATSFTNSSHVIELPQAGTWAYFVIETANSIPHPIHLHGHDFYLLAQGSGTFNASTTAMTLKNPPRRDVAMLPLSGYVVLGFPSDNPGAWLMHCHIGWHTEEGLALQILEMADELPATITQSDITDTCDLWDSWTSTTNIDAVMDYQDSGI